MDIGRGGGGGGGIITIIIIIIRSCSPQPCFPPVVPVLCKCSEQRCRVIVGSVGVDAAAVHFGSHSTRVVLCRRYRLLPLLVLVSAAFLLASFGDCNFTASLCFLCAALFVFVTMMIGMMMVLGCLRVVDVTGPLLLFLLLVRHFQELVNLGDQPARPVDVRTPVRTNERTNERASVRANARTPQSPVLVHSHQRSFVCCITPCQVDSVALPTD